MSHTAPVMLLCSFPVHRPVEQGSVETAKGKSSAGARKTSTTDIPFKTTPFKTTEVLKKYVVVPPQMFLFLPFSSDFSQDFKCIQIHYILQMNK